MAEHEPHFSDNREQLPLTARFTAMAPGINRHMESIVQASCCGSVCRTCAGPAAVAAIGSVYAAIRKPKINPEEPVEN